MSRSDGVDPLQRWIAWGAMLTASVVPMIFSHSTGHGPPYSVPAAQALVLAVAPAKSADRISFHPRNFAAGMVRNCADAR